MKTKLRFAPSPTGNLHVGNARTALVNYLFCKSISGEMMLRIDAVSYTHLTLPTNREV